MSFWRFPSPSRPSSSRSRRPVSYALGDKAEDDTPLVLRQPSAWWKSSSSLWLDAPRRRETTSPQAGVGRLSSRHSTLLNGIRNSFRRNRKKGDVFTREVRRVESSARKSQYPALEELGEINTGKTRGTGIWQRLSCRGAGTLKSLRNDPSTYRCIDCHFVPSLDANLPYKISGQPNRVWLKRTQNCTRASQKRTQVASACRLSFIPRAPSARPYIPLTAVIRRQVRMSGLDNVSSSRPLSAPDVEAMHFNPPRIDSYRFSMANLEDSQDVELDAILRELCALGSQFEQEIGPKNEIGPALASKPSPSAAGQTRSFGGTLHRRSHSRSSSGGQKLHSDNNEPRSDPGCRTDSPDADSAFSDNISMLSSESSASSGTSAARTDASKSSGTSGTSTSSGTCSPQAEVAARLKAEKIRLALEKLKEANIKKLFIKAFTADGSTKSLLVDEKMTVGHVTRLLADKNHVRMDPKWALVEHLPDLHMERVYEDHEMLVDQLMLWTRDSKNTLLFVERPEKYALFHAPENFLLVGSSSERDRQLDDEARSNLLEEFFSSSGVGVPEIEGPLYLKADGKKAWKKYYFVLRASGLYYCPKGKSKSSKDLVCLATFEANQVYESVGWRKKHKAPTEFGFALKHPKLQSKSSKFIRYLCADDVRTRDQWVMGIRIAKAGRALCDNYRALLDELAQEDLDKLAQARSCSLASVQAAPNVCGIEDEEGGEEEESRMHMKEREEEEEDECMTPVGTLNRTTSNAVEHTLSRQDSILSRASSDSSSGCLSEPSSGNTPTFEHAFDSDFPMGTIKRKPSMTPKLPLTSTTRLLVKEVQDAVDGEVTEAGNVARNSQRHSFRKSLTEEVNTIRRKVSVNTPPMVPDSDKLSDVDLLQLPPPPVELLEESLDDDISESLPPPPPPQEMFGSTLDLSDLPLPPQELLSPATTVGVSPVKSLPPKVPPKPVIVTMDAIPRKEAPEAVYGNSPSFPCTNENEPVVTLPKPIRKNSQSEMTNPTTKSPKKRITFSDVTETVPVRLPPPTPPKRNDTTRLSFSHPKPLAIPQKLNSPGCTVTPPRDFLKDLQRVMQKKWQVSQKCKADLAITPHEVLGFRDPVILPTNYNESSVSAWVREHYGNEDIPPSVAGDSLVYENVFVPGNTTSEDVYQSSAEIRSYPHPYLPSHSPVHSFRSNGNEQLSKKPPPPLPKRNETTQLSTRIHLM